MHFQPDASQGGKVKPYFTLARNDAPHSAGKPCFSRVCAPDKLDLEYRSFRIHALALPSSMLVTFSTLAGGRMAKNAVAASPSTNSR
jgi:hypothetical protein